MGVLRATQIVSNGEVVDMTFGDGAFITGRGVARITFSGRHHYIQPDQFPGGVFGIKGVTYLLATTEEPVVVYDGTDNVYAGQPLTIEPEWIRTAGDDSVTRTDTEEYAGISGNGKAYLSYTPADSGHTGVYNLQLLNQPIGLNSFNVREFEAITGTMQFGKLVIGSEIGNEVFSGLVLNPGQSRTIVQQNSYINGVEGNVSVQTPGYTAKILNFADQGLTFPFELKTGAIVTALDNPVLVADSDV